MPLWMWGIPSKWMEVHQRLQKSVHSKGLCHRLCGCTKIPVRSSVLHRCLHVPSVQARVLEQLLEGGHASISVSCLSEEAAVQGAESLHVVALTIFWLTRM